MRTNPRPWQCVAFHPTGRSFKQLSTIHNHASIYGSTFYISLLCYTRLLLPTRHIILYADDMAPCCRTRKIGVPEHLINPQNHMVRQSFDRNPLSNRPQYCDAVTIVPPGLNRHYVPRFQDCPPNISETVMLLGIR
jgi:hypothetical protein